MKFTTVLKNTTLYRGTKNSKDYMRNGPVYFLYNTDGKKIAERSYTKYGGKVITYVLKQDVELIDMSKSESIRFLMTKVKDTKESNNLIRSFQISKNGKEIYRNSEGPRDLIVANMICKLGYDGYIAPKLKKSENTLKNNLFHQEIVLCNPKNKVIHENNLLNNSDPFSTPVKKEIPNQLGISSPVKRSLNFKRFRQ